MPLDDAKLVGRPMLFLQGGRDYQVTEEDFNGWKQALGGSPSASFRFYGNLNHLMQRGIGKAKPQEYFVPAPVDSRVTGDIALFVSAAAARRERAEP